MPFSIGAGLLEVVETQMCQNAAALTVVATTLVDALAAVLLIFDPACCYS